MEVDERKFDRVFGPERKPQPPTRKRQKVLPCALLSALLRMHLRLLQRRVVELRHQPLHVRELLLLE